MQGQGQGPRPQGPGQGQGLSLQGRGQRQELHFLQCTRTCKDFTFCSHLVRTYLQSRDDSKRA